MANPTRSREPTWHRRADAATGMLLYSMVVFSTWAFGSLPTWSIWALNCGGYLLGFLWLFKLWMRRASGFEPLRLGATQSKLLRFGLGTVTVLLLLWCLISAVNARSTIDLDLLQRIEHPPYIAWLPHSYDRPATGFAFWQYLALAALFWALRDWLTIASPSKRQFPSPHYRTAGSGVFPERLPHRLRKLMWVLSINGGAVALAGIISAADEPTRLLWTMPLEGRESGFFGPFYYRNQGAAYVNLVWPLCLGLWLAYGLRAAQRGILAAMGRSRTAILPLCLGLMVAAPFVSSSRGGSVIAILLLALALPVLVLSLRVYRGFMLMVSLTVLLGGGLGLWLASESLTQRFFRDFFAYPTGIDGNVNQFTLRSTIRIPARWGREAATFAGLSDDSRSLWNTPGSVTLSLRRPGVFEARFVESDRTRILTLSATNHLLAEPGRTVELIFSHAVTQSSLYLNGKRLQLRTTKSRAGFEWPEALASRFLWVGRGASGSMKYYERIEAVTLLDRALPESLIQELADREPRQTSTFDLGQAQDRWSAAELNPKVHVRPYTLSPAQWIAAGLGGRGELYEMSHQMMAGYPGMLGSGPGTFARLFMVFRRNRDPGTDWHAHDDHLETRLTFGLAGAALVYLGLILCAGAAVNRGGLHVPWCVFALLVAALGGSLAHARFDWLFQNYAMLLLGIVVCAVCSVMSIRQPVHPGSA